MELNERQKAAVEFVHGVAAVIAAPGAGKTLCMSKRIANLIQNHGVAPESILGLTFTRSAAQAMRERLASVIAGDAMRVNLSTIHSHCLSLLREEGRVFEILSGNERLIFMRKLIQKLRLRDVSTGTAMKEISLAKSNLISPEEFMEFFQVDKSMAKIAEVYAAYEAEKNKRMCRDFDDFVFDAYRLLSEDAKVRKKVRAMYSHLLVDEFQDTNPAQMELLLLIGGKKKKGSFCVYGDDYQAVFGFLGASVGNILNFEQNFAGSKIFILGQNYRSSKNILRACENLISHNVRKIEKRLETSKPDGEEVVLIDATTDQDEAMRVAVEITDLVERKGVLHKEIAVLYRANYQSRMIEEVLAEYDIPYKIENGRSFYQRFEVRVLLDYLRLINDPDSDDGDEALRSIINIPNRYISRGFVRDLEEYAFEKGTHLYQALKTLKVELPYVRKNVRQFVKLLDTLIQKAETLSPAELIDLLRAGLDYDRFIAEDDVAGPDDSRIANVDELSLAAAKYDDVESFLHFTETFKDEAANDKNGVSLMTIHKSKGMEFPVVIVIGLVEGILPTKKGDIEEERRIAFVGLSRAMERLYLCSYRSSGERSVQRSIFIDEIFSAT